MNGGAWWITVHGVAESDMTERLTLSLFTFNQLGKDREDFLEKAGV